MQGGADLGSGAAGNHAVDVVERTDRRHASCVVCEVARSCDLRPHRPCREPFAAELVDGDAPERSSVRCPVSDNHVGDIGEQDELICMERDREQRSDVVLVDDGVCAVQTGLVLQVNSNPTLNVTLQLGQIAETITVQGTAALVETRNPGIGQVITNQQVVELPLNGRQLTELIFQAGLATGGKGTNDAPGGNERYRALSPGRDGLLHQRG